MLSLGSTAADCSLRMVQHCRWQLLMRTFWSLQKTVVGKCRLPEPLQPSLEDFLGLSAQGLPVWMSELFEAGFFNTVNTRVFPSLKCSAAISHWVANHPDQALPEVGRRHHHPLPSCALPSAAAPVVCERKERGCLQKSLQKSIKYAI